MSITIDLTTLWNLLIDAAIFGFAWLLMQALCWRYALFAAGLVVTAATVHTELEQAIIYWFWGSGLGGDYLEMLFGPLFLAVAIWKDFYD